MFLMKCNIKFLKQTVCVLIYDPTDILLSHSSYTLDPNCKSMELIDTAFISLLVCVNRSISVVFSQHMAANFSTVFDSLTTLLVIKPNN